MTPTDLRIGNYVYYEHTTHIVSGVHGNKVYSWWVKDGEPVIEYEAKDISGTQVENPYMDVVSQYEPIPLNKVWLLNFGFDMKDKNRLDWVKGAFNLERSNEDDSKFCFEVYSHYIPLDYVHQFQNLYFTLTGEELKLK